jgi:ceramide glucosyltransferase
VRTVRPAGYALSFLTYAVPTSLLFMLCFQSYYLGAPIVTLAVALRLVLHRTVRTRMGIEERRCAWLVPIRDIVCFAVWAASFLGRDVQWRQQHLSVRADGQIALKETNVAS